MTKINNKNKTQYTQNSQVDWLEFALEVLIEKGPDSLKVTPLCELKGVTKGSFYHHFKNRDEFINILMTHWYQKMTLNFITQANSEELALERLKKLDKIIAGNNIVAEMHIRAWALKEQSIAQHLEKIDQQRQDYLANCYLELGVEKKAAKDIALITYSNFLGMQQVYPKPTLETVLRITSMTSQGLLYIQENR